MADIRRLVIEDPQPPPTSELALSGTQVAFYAHTFDEVWPDVLGVAEPGSQVRLHDIGEAERSKVIDRLDCIEARANLVLDALDRRERAENERREIEIKLQSTSDDPHVAELVARAKGISQRIGELQEKHRALTVEIDQLEDQLKVAARNAEQQILRREARGKAQKTVRLAQKARVALDEFIKRLAPEKLTVLEERMKEMYGRLRKPEDPVHSIQVDADTWRVILLDAKGRPLEKRGFSAGMKEMYALSLLWALARASGKELPIVIDTPVGRLDSTNRRALFERYLPCAGHQVIVLCTDTEVDKAWARQLEPYVARQYRLDHDPASDSSVIRRGFFS